MHKVGIILTCDKISKSRYGQKEPLAVSIINHKDVLQKNIDMMKKYVDEVFIAITPEYGNLYSDFYDYLVFIPSGDYGSGHAIYNAIYMLSMEEKINNDTDIFLIWGNDNNLTDTIYAEVLSHTDTYKGNSIIYPVTYKKNPETIIEFLENKNNKQVGKLRYNDFNEIKPDEEGYDNLGLFYFNGTFLFHNCLRFREKYCDFLDDIYYTKHGNKFNFFDLINFDVPVDVIVCK